MSSLIETIGRWLSNLKCFVMVQPWEQAIRVRMGARVVNLSAGAHLRIPFVDSVYRQSVRLRSAYLNTQTLSTRDGHTVVVGATVGYSIADVRRLYERLHHADETLSNMAAVAIAERVFSTDRESLCPVQLASEVTCKLRGAFKDFGIAEDVNVRVTDFAFLRAIRLVQDGRYTNQDQLDTKVIA